MIRVSLRLGGIVAGADERQLSGLDTYGKKLGLAFQIIDDLLDLQGDEAALGKRANKDQEHGKLTFPAVLGVTESRRRAERLIEEAIAALEPFGNNAAGLQSLARYVLERNH
jgi:geranylgeranyl diphosphate synthase, type II